MSFKLFKSIFNKFKDIKIDVNECKSLRPIGKVTIWENEEIVVQDNNLIVDSFFDIIAGIFVGDTNKIINNLSLGDGGIIDSVLQTPTVNDTHLYNEVYLKEGYESFVVENITDRYISYIFKIEKDEANGPNGANIVNEIGLMSTDGTMFARKTFKEIIKTSEKTFTIEWRIQW